MPYIPFIFLAILFPLITACAPIEYTYTPPATQEGKQCVTQCQQTQGACRNNEYERAQDEYPVCQREADYKYQDCEMQSQADYTACLRYANTEKDQDNCSQSTCFKDMCSSTPDFDFCDSEFRMCYQNCGGKVGIMK